MTFSEKLKEARKQAGLSQEQLAEQLHISRSAIAKWEAGLGIPDVENLKALSQLLNLSMDDLLDDTQTLEEARSNQAEKCSDTYCGKSCDGCTYQEALTCTGCKAYSHTQPGGCAIARCCQDRKITHCGNCGYQQHCNKVHARMQAPAQRRSIELRHAELQARNESLLEHAKVNLTLLAKYMPRLFKIVKLTIACSVFELLLGRFIPNLDVWIVIPLAIIRCLYAATLLRMHPVHHHYRAAGLLLLILAPMSAITDFLPARSAIYFLILLAGSALQLVGKRFEYNAHADALQDLDSELSKKWRSLWNWEMLCICCVFMSTLVAMITTIPLFASITLIATFALVVVSCLEWVYLSRSAGLFRDYPVNALLNRVRHRLNNPQ